jgi:hypothetical protein
MKTKTSYNMKKLILNLTLGVAVFGAASPTLAQTSLVAGWSMYNPSSQAFPYAASTIAPSVASASMNYAGLLTHNDNRGVWGSANGDTTLDTATAPYLSWTLTLDAGTTVSDPTFFINLAKVDGSGTQLDLRSSLDDYAVSLGSPSSVDGTYRNYMFPVGESLCDSVTFRLYVYDVSPGMQTDSDNIYNVWCQSYYTTSGDTYNANMQGQTAGVLGNVTAVPEPSALALAGSGLLGLLLFRRRKA